MLARPAAIGSAQVRPPSSEPSRSTPVTPKLSLAVQTMSCVLPASQFSPPLGDMRATTGGSRSSGVPELVIVVVYAPARTVSTPAGSHVAEMTTCPLATWSQAGSGATPLPVSVQNVRTFASCSRVSVAATGWPYELPLPTEITAIFGCSAASQAAFVEVAAPWWCTL